MNELAALLRDFTPGAYGIWTGVLMFAAWWLREWRETRKLSLDDRNARREGYAKQVELLMRENRALGEDIKSLRGQYDDYRVRCEGETDQLRTHIVALENRVTGFRRMFATLQITMARFIAQVMTGELPSQESLKDLTAILASLNSVGLET